MIPGVQRARRSLRRLARTGIVLLYHRVGTAGGADPWGLRVSPERFEAHLVSLRRQGFDFCRLTELPERWPVFRKPGRVAVAFDDGYRDNAATAAPILVRHGVPATFFIVSGSVGSDEEFWWDHLERLIIGSHALPHAGVDVRIDGSLHRWDVPGALADESWSLRLYWELWTLMRALPDAERVDVLRQLTGQIAHAPPPRRDRLPMDRAELVELAGNALFEIGAHTVSHPVLAAMTPDEQQQEILDSKIQIEAMVGRSISCFSYPHGSYSAATVEAVRAAGFRVGCTTRPGSVVKGQSAHLLPRCFVRDWERDDFERHTTSWSQS